MQGKIHSIESMGLVDGPGIRTVVFLQGCSLRCRYCHNPDTWSLAGGEELSPRQLVVRLKRFLPYFSRSGGGVTFSGGEPLLQPEFLAECLRLCKQAGIHTCIDTAGAGLGDYAEILANTDLLLFDVKATESDAYTAMTGQAMARSEAFLQAVKQAGTPVWVRHVVIPGMTDSDEHLRALQAYIAAKVPNVQRVELLGYHVLGVNKYEKLQLPYSLAKVPAMEPARLQQLQNRFFPLK